MQGLCLGDSGGPLFKTYEAEDKSRMSVLIGVVSRGTGSRGNCGGLENATHYVRIKQFIDWIKVSITLCKISVSIIKNYKFQLFNFFSALHQ